MVTSAPPMEVHELFVPSPADFHVHLRQGAMSELVTPHVKQGGFLLAYVMPNLVPPISSTEAALQYKSSLQKLAPDVEFMVTLYLGPDITPEEIHKAAKAGISGVKSYPRGVTTNSSGGIESYDVYYPIFEAMQECDMVLNLHGEVPSNDEDGTCVLNAEERFLTHLRKLHADFPRLRIVLEHATTKAAVETVKSLGPSVGCTITAHHLALIVDDWAGKPLNFCKPVAKFPSDREALRQVIKEGHPRFFLGSDSAPHPISAKMPQPSASAPAHTLACSAGVYTQPVLLPLVATLLESFGALDKLNGFVSEHGRAFYRRPVKDEKNDGVRLRRAAKTAEGSAIPASFVKVDADGKAAEVEVVPFWAGKHLGWEIVSP